MTYFVKNTSECPSQQRAFSGYMKISHCLWIGLWVVCALGELIFPQLQNILCDIVATDSQASKYYSRSNTSKQCGDRHSYQKSLGLMTECSNN